MSLILKDPFTFNEQRIIHTAIYVYQNSDHSLLNSALKRDIRSGIPSVLQKLNSGKPSFSFCEFIAIEYSLIYLHNYFLNPCNDDVVNDLKVNGRKYFELIRSVGQKIHSDYDFFVPNSF